MTRLLESFGRRHLLEDQRVEDGEDVLAVGEDSFQGWLRPGFAECLALPALEDLGWHVNILAEFLERMPAQEEAVKEGCLVLRFGELVVERGSHTAYHGKRPVGNVKRNRHDETKGKDIS